VRVVIAGYGYLGKEIYSAFESMGHETIALRRSANGDRTISCDLTQLPTTILNLGEIDLSIFCLAPGSRDLELYERTYVIAQQNFLNITRARRHIYISSTAVYPDQSGRYAESDASPHNAKAAILLAAEKLALASPRSVVLRLAGLYDKERPIYRTNRIPHDPDRVVHFIHRDDAVRAVVHAATQDLVGVFNVHDGAPQRRGEILERLGLGPAPEAEYEHRIILAEKFRSTGYNPKYTNYYSGIGFL